jgi:hypothetical protein
MPEILARLKLQMLKMRAWLEIQSRWSKLRELGQSGLVRSSVLMPVVGYLLLLNEHFQAFLSIHHYDVIWPFDHLPSLWRLWLLFYGSFFLAIGSMLFAWRCPPEIKQYAASSHFVEAETRQVHFNKRGQDQVADRLKSLYGDMSRWQESLFNQPRLKPELPNLGAGTSPELATGDQWGLGLSHIWSLNDIRRPVWRIMIFALFWTGLLLVGFPAVVTFLQVTFIVAKH